MPYDIEDHMPERSKVADGSHPDDIGEVGAGARPNSDPRAR
jgi:hypothetical protein